MKITFGDIKDDIAEILSTCNTDTRVLAYLNEAQERLINRGKFLGTVQRYKICVNDNCLTWPRQIETIESFSVCRLPGQIRNEWYEFNEGGYGQIQDDDCLPGVNLIDRGEVCAFDDITSGQTDRKIKVYSDLVESNCYVILQGYDENGNWIRTVDGGSYIDGEKVVPSQAGVSSTKKFIALTGVQKTVTNGNLRLYEIKSGDGSTVKSLAIYEPDETRPLYRRSIVPGLTNMGACCDTTDSTCAKKYINVIAKLRHIPVAADGDWLLLRSRAALRLGVMAILKEKKDLLQEAEIYWGKAITELQREVEVHYGDGVIPTIRLQQMETFGCGAVEAII
jgi:hypothetical protein